MQRPGCATALAFCLLQSLTVDAAFAEPPGDVVASVGNWVIHREQGIDQNKVHCVATLIDNDDVRVSPNKRLYVGVKGYPRGFQVRFDDLPVGPLRPYRDGYNIGAIKLDEDLFQSALQSSRLRIAVATDDGVEQFDLKIAGLAQAYDYIISERCR